jgi:hypothetical protein
VKEPRRSTALALALSLLLVVLVALLVETARAVATSDRYWWALARCETGARWHQRGTYYVGGLGIWYGNWQKWAPAVGVRGPAWAATPHDQIRVAIYGRAVDRAYWGCMRIVGMPW